MEFSTLLSDIISIDQNMSSAAGRTVDRLFTVRNWLVGACIVEYEQRGEDRAAYGDQLLLRLAEELRRSGRRGFSVSNLKNFRQVALTWPGVEIRPTLSGVLLADELEIRQTLSGESSTSLQTRPSFLKYDDQFPSLRRRRQQMKTFEWQDQAWLEKLFSSLSFSHLLELSRIEEPLARAFYELHSVKERWTLRVLQRQKNSMLFERVGLSTDREAVLTLSREGREGDRPETLLRDPYVLEFLGLEPPRSFLEKDLESALITHLERFMLELGRDFCFMARQFRITVGNRHHHLDLMFFHRRLRCIVAVDLKVAEFEPADAGQMRFYLNYLAKHVCYPDENPPVGILMCAARDAEVVQYATAGMQEAVFVSRYMLELPSEEMLARWLRQERAVLELETKES